jgi:hypothetical protein
LGAAPTRQQPQAWYAQPPEPDNGAAVAGFVTSVASAAVLVMSFGFGGVLTLIAAPFGIYFSRKGKQAVREGRTRKHEGLAQAGFIVGIIVLVLSILAVVGLILFIIGVANDDSLEPGRGVGTQT